MNVSYILAYIWALRIILDRLLTTVDINDDLFEYHSIIIIIQFNSSLFWNFLLIQQVFSVSM